METICPWIALTFILAFFLLLIWALCKISAQSGGDQW